MRDMMDPVQYFTIKHQQLQDLKKDSALSVIRNKGLEAFTRLGIPTLKHEEWKHTRISGLFNKDFEFAIDQAVPSLSDQEIKALRLPGHEVANEIVFVNGCYSPSLSRISTGDHQLRIVPLEEAARNEYREFVSKHLGHSGNYLKDGINALNTAFAHEGVFIHVKKGHAIEYPIYLYHITDSRTNNNYSQVRNLILVSELAQVQIVQTFGTIGPLESFANEVTEIVAERDSITSFYKIQNENSNANLVSTTHIHQIGKSQTHTVTISLDGGIVRNNLNIVLDAENCESHLCGLYLIKGQTHVDNHTTVDNVKPNCFSNELYKGIMDEQATGVFNGKIFVRPQAQKTNAYQSNKNVLLSNKASVNTKPQLEIFADDVKCSHGCTVGSLDEEALFYLRSRGIGEKKAQSLLLHGFAADILEDIKIKPIRDYIDHLITERLEYEES